MDMNAYNYRDDDTFIPVDLHMFLNGTRIRVYYLSNIDIGYYRRSDMLDELRFYSPVPNPYTWYVYGDDQAAIVDINDLQQAYQQQQQQSSSYYYYYDQHDSDEEVAIRVLQQSFQQASDEFVACSGLTKKEIFENLEITEYYCEEEESEVCVICQVEYEKNEKVGVIQCGHRFHPECIQEWLFCKNVCPLCKHQALN